MFKKILNAFRIPELRNKLLFTIAMLCVYRIGFYIPLPGVDAVTLRTTSEAGNDTTSVVSNYLSTFSGGDLSQSTIFGLGIMPYISASIILQLMGTVVPALEKLKKEGEPGIRKINEWTRYLTVGVCFVQAAFWARHLMGSSQLLIYPAVKGDFPHMFIVMTIIVLTAGSVFLMWLGEQIDQYGIGNGVSLIITAGIVSRMPHAIYFIYNNSPFKGFFENVFGGLFTGNFGMMKQGLTNIGSQMSNRDLYIGPSTILFLACCFVFVVGAAIFLTQAQRRIRIQQAKHMRGRRVYGGSSQYLPLRVNQAGVMPIIFASSLMLFPTMLFTWLGGMVNNTNSGAAWAKFVVFMATYTRNGSYLYEICYCTMIFLFSYFWNTVQFQPKELANQLRDYGSFVPGLRPGKRTADYLENVMGRITYVGAAFLCVIAVIPSVIGTYLLGNTPEAFQTSQFLGGTGLLIVISVMLDLVNRIEANLVMRNYSGFMDDDSGGGSGSKIRRPKTAPTRGPAQPSTAFDKGKGLPA